MNAQISRQVQDEQDHGRQKYGRGPKDYRLDDRNTDAGWHRCIKDHNDRALHATPMERRQHLIKVAGLAISAVEAFDRKQQTPEISAALKKFRRQIRKVKP